MNSTSDPEGLKNGDNLEVSLFLILKNPKLIAQA